MLHKIEDETGQTWLVGKGDPAYTLVQKLHTRHYTWIVLMRGRIMGGTVIEEAAAHGVNLIRPMIRGALKHARQIDYNTTEGKRYLRLAECLKVLGG